MQSLKLPQGFLDEQLDHRITAAGEALDKAKAAFRAVINDVQGKCKHSVVGEIDRRRVCAVCGLYENKSMAVDEDTGEKHEGHWLDLGDQPHTMRVPVDERQFQQLAVRLD